MPAKDYIDNARKIADRASGISVVLFAGLVISALNDFGPKLATFRDAVITERAQNNHEAKQTINAGLGAARLKELQDIVNRLTKQIEESDSNYKNNPRNVRSKTVEQLMEVQFKLQNAKENLRQAEQAYKKASEMAAVAKAVQDAQRRATERVKLKGFGFELGVQGNWASIVWLLLFLLGVVNLSFARYGFAAEIRAGAKDEEGVFESLRTPLWLHPISDSPLTNVSPIVFFDTLALAVVLLVVGCAVAAFWMARLSLVAPVLLASGHEIQGRLAGITVGCITATILVVLSSWIVPVRLKSRAEKVAGDTVRRRLLIALPILAVTCSAAAAPASLRRMLQQTLLSPRRRRRIRGVALEPGFYVHKKTHKIHYVPLEGYAKSLRGADISNFTKIDPTTLTASQRPFVHVKALVPYARQMLKNLGRDYDATARLLIAILNPPERSSLTLVPATGPIAGPETGKPKSQRRKKGGSARSHGQRRRKLDRHRDVANIKNQRGGINPPFQFLQICDLLARLAARTGNRQYIDIALQNVTTPIRDSQFERDGQRHKGTFIRQIEQIKDGMDSRLMPKKRPTLRWLESALRQLEEGSERRKHESDLLQIIKAYSAPLDTTERLERRANLRNQVWHSSFWMGEYNRKARLIRHRGKRKKKAKAVRV